MIRTKFSKRGIGFIILCVIVLAVLVLLGRFILSRAIAKTPIDLTKDFMNKYKNASKEVMDKVNYPYDDELTDNQLKRYKDIIKTQYLALDYDITDEYVGESDAIIKVEFEVFDYASGYEKASSYLSLYEKDMSLEKQVDYKLDEMSKTKEKMKYSISFAYYKLDGKWIMTELTKTDLQKLTGTF